MKHQHKPHSLSSNEKQINRNPKGLTIKSGTEAKTAAMKPFHINKFHDRKVYYSRLLIKRWRYPVRQAQLELTSV